jgi:transcriptional regulator with XRE-family HTH domain
MSPNKQTQQHWTERSTEDFVHRVAFDFIAQVEQLLEDGKSSQSDLAKALGVTEGRVSQVLNSPHNMELKSAVKLARALRRKVALVLYDDRDRENRNGPVSSDIFSRCWERSGRPTDVYALQNRTFAVSIRISSGTVIKSNYGASAGLGPHCIATSGTGWLENSTAPTGWNFLGCEFTSTLGEIISENDNRIDVTNLITDASSSKVVAVEKITRTA